MNLTKIETNVGDDREMQFYIFMVVLSIIFSLVMNDFELQFLVIVGYIVMLFFIALTFIKFIKELLFYN